MLIFFGRPLRTSYLLSIALLAARGFAQDAEAPQQAVPPPADSSVAPVKQAPADPDAPKQDQPAAANRAADMNAAPDKHVLGVLPNFRTVNDNGAVPPIDTKHKLIIACKDSFDYPLVLLSAGLAGIGQLANEDPSYHQGVEGYAKRLRKAA
jgi:hypothetical protein